MLKWILLGLLALLLLLLVVPVGVELRYRDAVLAARLRLLGVPITLLPAKEQPPETEEQRAKRAKKKKQREKPPEEQGKKQPMLIGDILALINDLLPQVGKLLGHTLRHITVKRLRASLPITGEDAAEVGISYGQGNALCYNIYVALASMVRLREWQVLLNPDFTCEQPTPIYFYTYIKASPAVMLWGILRFVVSGGVIMYNSPFIGTKTKTKNKATKKKKDGA